MELQDVLSRHTEVFRDELGLVKGMTAEIHVDPQAPPRFFKARSVPYALRGKVEKELERLERDGIIQPVQFSNWAGPIVPVVKRDGAVRICGDYKVTINRDGHVPSSTNRRFVRIARPRQGLQQIGPGARMSTNCIVRRIQTVRGH